MLEAAPLDRLAHDQLAEQIVRESRDPARSIGEIAVLAVRNLQPQSSVAGRLRSRIQQIFST